MFIVVFILVLSLLVLIHEFGHFITAKFFKIKVEEFGYGFPPRAWGKKIGETLYSINWLPIGGFVKLYGEDEAGGGKLGKGRNEAYEKKDIKRAFFARPAWQRAIVVVAGVIMNILLAIAIYYVFLMISNFNTLLPLYPSVKNPHFYFVNQVNRPEGLIVENIAKDSPAAQAGIEAPVKIVSINGKKVTSDAGFVLTVNANKGKNVTLVIQNFKTNSMRTVTLVPRENPPLGQGALGIGFNYYAVPLAFLTYDTPAQKAFSGVAHTINLTKYNFQIFGNLFEQSVKQRSAAPLGDTVSGPVGIASVFKEVFKLPTKEAVLQVLNIAGLISVSLAIFNILPIPALDGGRFAFIVVEMITGKKVSPKVEGMIHTVGMIVLIGLIVIITIRDVLKLF